jgi:putative oxidoreductase
MNFLFSSAAFDSKVADLGRLILRALAGLALAFAHGIGKVPPSEGFVGMISGLGLPGFFAYLSMFAEFFCALLLVLGLVTRPAALFILGNMLVVTILGHAGDPFGDRELPFLFGSVAIFFLLAGAGRYSLDALIRRRKV